MCKSQLKARSWFLAYIAVGFLTCCYMQFASLGNDFQVYFDAGDLIVNFRDPWNSTGNPNALYLHGPITSSWIWIFSLFPYSVSLTILRILTLALIPLILWMILDLLDIQLHRKINLWNLSTFALMSFPIRSILNYGRFEVLIFFLFILIVYLLKKKPKVNLVLVICGLIMGVIIDYKPQIFLLPCLILLWHYPKIRLILGSLISVIFGSFVSVILTAEFPYWTWFNMLHLRSRDTSIEKPLGLFSIYYGFGLSPLLSVAVGFILISLILLRLHKGFVPNKIQSTVMFFFVYLFFYPLLHAQDLVWIPLILVTLLAADNSLIASRFFWIVSGLVLTWSNNYFLDAIILISISIWVLFNFSSIPLEKRAILIFLFALPSFIFHLTAHFFPTPADGNLRHILVLCDYFLTVGLLVRHIVALKKPLG